jgi:hypothetical protein
MKDNEEKLWVEIETNKGTSNISSYRGHILVEDFNGWVTGRLNKKCIHLYESYWVEGEGWIEDPAQIQQPIRVANYRIMGYDDSQYSNHSGDIFLIAEHIVIIALLKGSFERDKILQKAFMTH